MILAGILTAAVVVTVAAVNRWIDRAPHEPAQLSAWDMRDR